MVQDGNTTATYVYDENSNRVARINGSTTDVSTYDAQDRLLSYGTNSYQYSANGELASKTTDAGTSRYTYDEIGNLMSANLPDGTRVEYVIDGANRRIGKKLNGVLVQDNQELTGPTAHQARPPYKAHAAKLPLGLQDHGNPVRFRNVWVRELGEGR